MTIRNDDSKKMILKSIDEFTSKKQVREYLLLTFYRRIQHPHDNFFDDLYNQFEIKSVFVTRIVNANAEYLGVPLIGRAFRSNLLLKPHKSIFTSIPNSKLAS